MRESDVRTDLVSLVGLSNLVDGSLVPTLMRSMRYGSLMALGRNRRSRSDRYHSR